MGGCFFDQVRPDPHATERKHPGGDGGSSVLVSLALLHLSKVECRIVTFSLALKVSDESERSDRDDGVDLAGVCRWPCHNEYSYIADRGKRVIFFESTNKRDWGSSRGLADANLMQ